MNTADKDRYYICEIGRLFWKDNKQCYAPEAVYRKVKELIKSFNNLTMKGGELT